MSFLPLMNASRMDLFSDLNRISNDAGLRFGVLNNGSRRGGPEVCLLDNGEQLIVEMEIPGLKEEDFKVVIKSNRLFIEAKVNEESLDEASYIRNERKSGDYFKELRLPYDVESDLVTAEYKNGVLSVYLPRSEASKPKVIKVKSI
jgi:HSP20 family protein